MNLEIGDIRINNELSQALKGIKTEDLKSLADVSVMPAGAVQIGRKLPMVLRALCFVLCQKIEALELKKESYSRLTAGSPKVEPYKEILILSTEAKILHDFIELAFRAEFHKHNPYAAGWGVDADFNVYHTNEVVSGTITSLPIRWKRLRFS
jgi:hypothetical protein